MFRSFVMGLWAFLLNALLKRSQATRLALWLANVIAALAFSVSHLPAMMLLFGQITQAQMPVTTLVELFLLNSIISLLAGERFMHDGLVAAIGVHFWADIIWHVIWPLVVETSSQIIPIGFSPTASGNHQHLVGSWTISR